MELTIKKQENNSLIQRTEIEATLILNITPSNEQVKEELSKKFNKDKELIVIKHIYSKFGIHENKIIAYIYDNKEALTKFEPKKKEKEEKKPEEKKEEKPKEAKEEKKEKKEEKKQEIEKEPKKEEKKEEQKQEKQQGAK